MSQNPYQPPRWDGGPQVAFSPAVAELQKWQSYRRYAVYAALGLLVLSLVVIRIPVLVYARAACWAAAGVLSLMEGRAAKAAGIQMSTGFRTVLYFVVALLPLARGM